MPPSQFKYDVTMDASLDVAYIKIAEGQVARSAPSDDGVLVYDLDQNGVILGVEVLSVTKLKTATVEPPTFGQQAGRKSGNPTLGAEALVSSLLKNF